PLHTMPYYKKQYKLQDDDFPESLSSFSRVISLPIWPGLEPREIERVITAVKGIGKAHSV
ncbi:MAG: DegT/DnrJ/EryC1/StrS family aminotransferase, partial [Treponema sp.]|nr:DegT/DnrJ/EryC1/StrS family aminotransferase [Treponema sp.]